MPTPMVIVDDKCRVSHVLRWNEWTGMYLDVNQVVLMQSSWTGFRVWSVCIHCVATIRSETFLWCIQLRSPWTLWRMIIPLKSFKVMWHIIHKQLNPWQPRLMLLEWTVWDPYHGVWKQWCCKVDIIKLTQCTRVKRQHTCLFIYGNIKKNSIHSPSGYVTDT